MERVAAPCLCGWVVSLRGSATKTPSGIALHVKNGELLTLENYGGSTESITDTFQDLPALHMEGQHSLRLLIGGDPCDD